jgi:integrase
VERQDLQRWTVWLLGKYSTAYASNQFRAARRFLRWLAMEEDRPDPTSGLRAPKVKPRLVPVFTSDELLALRKACQGRSFGGTPRSSRCSWRRRPPVGTGRDPLQPLRPCPRRPGPCGPGDPGPREAGRERIVKISYQAARSVDRYLRVRAKHALAARPELWLRIGGRGPVTPDGIYQVVARAGKRAGVAVYPHRFRHHFSHTWLDCGGAGRDLMELNGWSSSQMLQWYGGSAGGARARRSYDRIMSG